MTEAVRIVKLGTLDLEFSTSNVQPLTLSDGLDYKRKVEISLFIGGAIVACWAGVKMGGVVWARS